MNYPIIDCHCHIYPEKIAEKAVGAIGSFYDIAMSGDGKCNTLINEGEKSGVKHQVIFSVATTPHQVGSINSFIASEVEKSKGRFSGLGTLHQDSEDIIGDLKHIEELGLKGVKMHPDFQKVPIDSEKLFPVYEYLSEKNLPILFHTGDERYDFSNPERTERILKLFPDLTVIGAHLGGWSMWKKASEILSEYPNFYVDCSSCFGWISPEEVKGIIRTYGAEKVIFGSDFPMWGYETELCRFEEMQLTDEENKKILYENAEKLFNIKL